MTTAIAEENATSSEPVAETQNAPLSFEEAVQKRAEGLNARFTAPQKEEAPEPEPEEEVHSQEQTEDPEEVEETQEPEAEEVEEAEQAEEPNDINWDGLTIEQIDNLAKTSKSRLVKRVAQLTAKSRKAEEDAQALQAQVKQLKENPENLLKSNKKEENPFKDITTVEELQKQYEAADQFIEFAEELLEANDHVAHDDIIYTEGNQEFTKQQIRTALKVNRKNKNKFLPAQLAEVQQDAQREQTRAALQKKAADELDWMNDKDSDIRMEYQNTINSPVFKEIMAKVKDAKPVMEYLTAHAVNSIKGRKEIPLDSKKPAVQPSKSSAPSGNAGGAPVKKATRQQKELNERFSKSGSIRDAIALRAAQIAQRQNK